MRRIGQLHIWRRPPHGVNLAADLKARLPHFRVRLIFDVGANIGQSAINFHKDFPAAVLHCFEPAPHAFAGLLKNAPFAICHKFGFSSKKGAALMIWEGSDRAKVSSNGTTSVELRTLDGFCSPDEEIDLLKIDTEGHDYEVLLGGREMIGQTKVGLIQVEAAMNCDNADHVPLQDFMSLLEPKGYRLFGMYEQVNEWLAQKPFLRRTNAVFISKRVANSAQPKRWTS